MTAGLGSGPPAVVLVSGGGTNLQAIIDRAARNELGIRIDAVISDRPGVMALERATRAGIPATVVDYRAAPDRADFDRRLAAAVDSADPSLVILAGFMRVLAPDLVQRYAGRMLNVHPSLLPRYPGLHTYRRALEAGDSHHGSTVHFVIPDLDAGPGLIQYRVPIRPGETEESLRERVQRGEYLIFPRAIAWCAAGRAEFREGAAWLDGARLDTPVIVDESAGR